MSPLYSCSLLLPRPPMPTLFPYTTLFRSDPAELAAGDELAQPIDRVRDVDVAHDRRAVEADARVALDDRSEEHTSELQSPYDLVCRLLLAKKTGTCRVPGRSRYRPTRSAA